MRKAGEEVVSKAKNLEGFDSSVLTSDSAYELAKLIYKLPDVIVESADKYEPSVVTRHIVDIAQAFNRFYQHERILVDDENELLSKLALVISAKAAIKNGLALLGMHAPEKM